MANGYRVRLESAVSDGTNIYTEMKISSPTQTLPLVRPSFPVGTTAATITAYMQKIADNGASLASAIGDIVGSNVSGA